MITVTTQQKLWFLGLRQLKLLRQGRELFVKGGGRKGPIPFQHVLGSSPSDNLQDVKTSKTITNRKEGGESVKKQKRGVQDL